MASDARRRGRSDLRRYVREIERASIVHVHNVELRISYMSGNSLTSGLFGHYVVHMNSNRRMVRSFKGSRKAKVIGLVLTSSWLCGAYACKYKGTRRNRKRHGISESWTVNRSTNRCRCFVFNRDARSPHASRLEAEMSPSKLYAGIHTATPDMTGNTPICLCDQR